MKTATTSRLSWTLRFLSVPVVLVLVLFLPAGSLGWVKGWLFLLVTLTLAAAALPILWRVNPAIFAARSRIQKGTKLWDRILIMGFLFPVIFAVFVAAALDDGRFHWFRLPGWAVGVGYALYLTGFALTSWAQAVNPFFEPGVRIQTDRGHHVIDTGLYAVVRHPGYAAACMMFAGAALSLGSLWALLPVALFVVLIVLRTVLEDRTLRRELPGYQEYTQRVRFRLVPHVW